MLTPSTGTLADYNAAVLAGNTTYARLIFPVQNITLDGDDISANGGIILNSILNSDIDLQMGKAVMTECVVHLINSPVFVGFDWTEEFELQFGVDINGTTNWVTVGYFTGVKPEKSVLVDIIEFTAYDRMRKFDMLADDFISSLTFPLTMAQIYSALCTYVGITSAVGNEMADSMALSFSESPFISGMTLRSILSAIAEANGCYAKITADGKVKLVWFSNQTSNYSVDGDDYFTVSVDEDDAPVPDYIRVGCTYDDSISGFVYPVGGSGECYQILDNPFLLNIGTADITTVLTNILSRLTSFGSYRPMSLSITGNWMVETGDIIEVDVKSTAYNMPVFARTFSWNGGGMDGYECTGNASRSEISESSREQLENGGKIANKYTIRSGVDITDEGVTVSAGRYLKLISGGVLDVQSTNFYINSEDGTVGAGDWGFDENGLSLFKTITITPTSPDPHDIDYKVAFNYGRASKIDTADYTSFITYGYFQYGQTPDGMNSLLAPYMRLGVIDNNSYTAGTGQDCSWELRLTYGDQPGVKPSMSPFPGYPAIVPTVNDYWSVGSYDKIFSVGYFNNLGGDCNQAYSDITSDAITWETGAVTKNNCSYTIYKWGKMVVLNMKIYIKSAISSMTVLGTLASDYRPESDVFIVASTLTAGSGQRNDVVSIRPNGQVRMPYAAASSNDTTCYYATIMYFTA